jgi:TrmH family RNA methyltransferase
MTNNELKFYSNLLKKEFRESEKLFLIEGTHLIEECLSSVFYSRSIRKIFIRKDYNDKLSGKLLGSGLMPEVITDIQFNKLSETINSQGIIAVVSIRKENINFNVKDSLIVALDDINDPGNLGTILRTCWWYGVDKVYLSTNSVDIFNSKVIRSTQGALFNLEIYTNINLKNELSKYIKKGWYVFISALDTENLLNEINIDVNKKKIIVFGNEAKGVNEELTSYKDFKTIKIRGYTKCESLNVGVSAGIILDYFRNRS